MKLIVCVPFKNRADKLEMLLRSLRVAMDKASDATVRIILVNDHSNPSELSRIKQSSALFGEVSIVDNKGVGPGAARNTVFNYLESEEYVAFTDSDCVVCEDWINEIMHLDNICSYSVIQGVPYFFMKQNVYGKWEEQLYHCMFSTYIDKKSSTCLMTDSRNLVLRRSVIELFAGKLFSENINKAAAESRVFMANLAKHNIQVQYAENIKVYHEDPTSILESCRQKYRHGHGRVELWGEHHPSINRLVDRYFNMPIHDGIPQNYVVPVHLAFLYGYFSNIGKMTAFAELCSSIQKQLKNINLGDILCGQDLKML